MIHLRRVIGVPQHVAAPAAAAVHCATVRHQRGGGGSWIVPLCCRPRGKGGRGFCDSGGRGGVPPVDITVVTQDLLTDQPPGVAGNNAKVAGSEALFDELDRPADPATQRKKGKKKSRQNVEPTEQAGMGLIERSTVGGTAADSAQAASAWSFELSNEHRAAALEQIREELDFDTLFDEESKPVARLTSHELAELEKTKFGKDVGVVPNWGIPGAAAGQTNRIFPGLRYSIDDIAGRQPPRRRARSSGDCKICAMNSQVDWRNVQLLNDYVEEFGKIKGRRESGMCGRHQREVAKAIKRARHMAFMPFTGKLKLS